MKKKPIRDGKAPAKGTDVSDEYADSYGETHKKPIDLEYAISHSSYLLLDGIQDQYELLDIGCGTAGYWRLMRRWKQIVGLDYSKKMLAVAREFVDELGLRNVELVHSSFRDYDPGRSFDAIISGTFGNYDPLTKEMFDKLNGMLRPGGVLVLSFQTPKSVRHALQVLFRRDRLYRYPGEFVSFMTRNGFDLKLTTSHAPRISFFGGNYSCFFRKRP